MKLIKKPETKNISDLLEIPSEKREIWQKRFDGSNRNKNFKTLFMFVPQRLIKLFLYYSTSSTLKYVWIPGHLVDM